MSSDNSSPQVQHAPTRRRWDRKGLWLAGVATALGVWWGVTAPEQSPVTPAPTSVAP